MNLDEEQQPMLNSSDDYTEPSDIDSSLEARLGFIKKVYSIINIQILFTGTLILLKINQSDLQEIKEIQIQLFYIAVMTTIILICCLLCNKRYARKTPLNYILFIIYSISSGYVISEICCFFALKYQIANVLIQLGISMIFIMTTGLTIFVWTAKNNVTFCKSILISLSLSLILLFIFYQIFPIFLMEMIYLVSAIFFYTVYITYDIYKIFDKKKHSLQKNDYILGALFLQIDIIFIFQDLLKYLTQLGKEK